MKNIPVVGLSVVSFRVGLWLFRYYYLLTTILNAVASMEYPNWATLRLDMNESVWQVIYQNQL